MKLSDKRSVLFLVLFLLAVSALIYHNTILLPPSFIHAWTQSERYAISLQFLNNGFDIFHPATFNLQTVEGITRVDLPLNEFIAALLMKIFGTSPVVFRSYMLFVSITGLCFLFLLSKRLTSSLMKSWLVVAFVFFSPLYTYYQAGFIPCVPAISFAFIAYYYFQLYKSEGIRKHFYLSLLFFFLAAIIRLPFFIFLFAFFLQQGYCAVRHKKFVRFEVLGFSIAFGLFISYSLYNVHLGRIYGNMFLDRFLPAKSFAELLIIFKFIYTHWLFQYFTFWHYLLLAVSAFFTLKAWRVARQLKERALWFNLFIAGCGSLIYFLLMACQFFDHDYYFLDSLFLPLVLFFLLSLRNIPVGTTSKSLAFFFFSVICMMFMLGDSLKNQTDRYKADSSDRVEATRQNFIGSEKFLDSIGISKDAKMLVIDSYSTNIPLYMMNRKGYTVYQTNRDNPLIALFRRDWDYVVIQDQFLFSDVLKYYPVVAAVIEPLSGNGKISVYRRATVLKSRTVEELLRVDKKACLIEETADFEGEQSGHFTKTDKLLFSDVKTTFAAMNPEDEYGVSFRVGANELKSKTGVSVKVEFDFFFKRNTGLKLVVTTANEGKTLVYQSCSLDDFHKDDEGMQKGMFYFTLPAFKNANDILSVYLWNPGKGWLQYDNFKVSVYSDR